MTTTLRSMFDSLFNRDFVLQTARWVGAVERVRTLHPADVLLALVCCAVGDEERSIATARRQLLGITGEIPEESSFYERLTPGMAGLAWLLFLRTVTRANRVQRKKIACALGLSLRDVRAVDATVVTLPSRAAAKLPSTDSKLGGFKITATLSLIEDVLLSAHFTDARQHDRKAFELPDKFVGVLFLMDRGYADHRLFADIDDGSGYFIIRLKDCSAPTVRTIRSGLAKIHCGKPMDRHLPFHGVVDLDASFTVRGGQRRIFRVVGIPVLVKKKGESELQYVWLATNLPAHRVAADTVGTIYRLRWSVENLFRTLKTVGRLDQLRSGKLEVIQVFVGATLLGLALAQAICALMRAARPGVEPSLGRVLALLLAHLPYLIHLPPEQLPMQLHRFTAALWREGVNPNPGRPFAWQRHLSTVGE